MRKLAADSKIKTDWNTYKRWAGKGISYPKNKTIQIKNQANENLKNARGQIVQKYGISSIVRPRYWLLLLTSAFLSKPGMSLIVFIFIGTILGSWLFGIASLLYAIYFLECIVALIINTVITIGNAVWFAVHGMTHLIMTAILDIVNGIAYYFVGPLVDGINGIAQFFNLGSPVSFDPIGSGTGIPIQPQLALSYVVPSTPISGGAFSLGFVLVKPGADIYFDTFQGVYSENGAILWFPEIKPDALSPDEDHDGNQDFLTPIDRPPDIEYSFDASGTGSFIDTIFEFLNWVGSQTERFYYPDQYWTEIQKGWVRGLAGTDHGFADMYDAGGKCYVRYKQIFLQVRGQAEYQEAIRDKYFIKIPFTKLPIINIFVHDDIYIGGEPPKMKGYYYETADDFLGYYDWYFYESGFYDSIIEMYEPTEQSFSEFFNPIIRSYMTKNVIESFIIDWLSDPIEKNTIYVHGGK